MTRHPKTPPHLGPSAHPTPHAELNLLLEQLVDGARTALSDNFSGAYLQGSFALGDHDAHSDADFLIVTRQDVADDQLASLQAMHARLHALPNPWAKRIEGSYFPEAVLRRWSDQPRDPPGQPRPADWADPGTSGRPPRVYPLLFKGNGEASLVRSEHDNTQIVRWVTREKGVVLAGPPPRQLIDPVTPAALRSEALPLIEEVTGWRADPDRLQPRWVQAFFVLLCCRMLHTLESGAAASKKAAAAWAAKALDPRWRPLIADAEAARTERQEAGQAPAPPDVLAETQAFLAYVSDRAQADADGASRSRDIIARALALKNQRPGGPGAARPDLGGGKGAPRRGGFTPPTVRPGGRGRRG